MYLDTEALTEEFGRMDDLLLASGYECVASRSDVTSYRKGSCPTVNLWKTGKDEQPIKADVHGARVTITAFDFDSLRIALERAEL